MNILANSNPHIQNLIHIHKIQLTNAKNTIHKHKSMFVRFRMFLHLTLLNLRLQNIMCVYITLDLCGFVYTETFPWGSNSQISVFFLLGIHFSQSDVSFQSSQIRFAQCFDSIRITLLLLCNRPQLVHRNDWNPCKMAAENQTSWCRISQSFH